jgi:hypothetical protein
MNPYFRSLPADEVWAIDAALSGQPFASICEGLTHFHGGIEAPSRAALLLRFWLRDGWIAGLQ